MNIHLIPDSTWTKILQGKENYEFESLSLKILLSKLKLKTKMKPDDEIQYINELKLLVKIQSMLPSMQRDINRIIARNSPKTKNVLFTLDEAIAIIKTGKKLLIAGDECLIQQLPKGNWIAGTIPYFVGTNGGLTTQELLFIDEIPEFILETKIIEYTSDTISNIYKDAFKNGFTIIIIPSSSDVHLTFALNALNFEKFANTPVIGWISGVMLHEIGIKKPKVAFGDSLKISESSAVAMHIQLPENYYAEASIINIFEQGDGDIITFEEDGFSFTNVNINGESMNFAKYLNTHKIDTRLPLVSDNSGVSINISFQKVDVLNGKVELYAPVFRGRTYKIAKPLENYVKAYKNRMKDINTNTIAFSFNCILNYVYGEMEGEKLENITCPITFGEIAYQLLNQTFAYLKIDKF